jgi:hypothetical protein
LETVISLDRAAGRLREEVCGGLRRVVVDMAGSVGFRVGGFGKWVSAEVA